MAVKQVSKSPLPGQLNLFERAAKKSPEKIAELTDKMSGCRVELAEKLMSLGWKQRLPKTGNPDHFQLMRDGCDTLLDLGGGYMVVGTLQKHKLSDVDEILLLNPLGLFPMDTVAVDKLGVWQDPLKNRVTAAGLLGWFKAGSGVTLIARSAKPGSLTRCGEYFGTRSEGGVTYLLLHEEQEDASVKKLKIKLEPGVWIRVCLVSALGSILLPDKKAER